MWRVDHASKTALYEQVVSLVEKAIADGRLSPGERLPAERVLAGRMGVNRSTVIRAFDDLEARGVLVRKRGSGTYVNNEKWGVQTYAVLNWKGPATQLPTRREAAFHRIASIMKAEAERYGVRFRDLSGDGLAPDLLPDIPVPQGMMEEAVRTEKGVEAARLGLPSLRETVRQFLAEQVGLTVPLEEILITSGSRQSLFLVTQCLLRPGDAVGVESPSYFYSLPVFQAAGLRLFPLPVNEGGVIPHALENIVRRRSLKMIFLNPVFHNPTGTVLRDVRKKAILEACAQARIPIFEDDAYGLLTFGTTRDLSPLKSWDKRSQVIYAGSLSSYAGSNIRAGWLVAPPAMVERLAEVRLMMDAGLSVLPQILARQYLDRVVRGHLPELRRYLAERADSLAAWLRRNFGNRMVTGPTPGGLYSYAVMADESEEAYQAAQQDCLRLGILPALGDAFGDGQPAFRFNHGLFQE